ncbi:hypothetical protein LAT59_04495 [Candidatus Gracilibacteria bacterium]|nr:hypothetical protein [Candidatus Gracilibacteria bacterium]
MIESAILGYYTFFDKTLKSTTTVVLLVAVLICLVGMLHQVEASALQSNTLGVTQLENIGDTQIIEIGEKIYKVSFQHITD